MKISCVSETVTVIELSPTEMEKYNFSIEKSDYSSPHTRKVLWSIIDEASKITGKNVEVNQGLEIDLLMISQGTPKTKYLLCDKDAGIYESRDINSFLDFAKATTHLRDSAESSFYYYEGCYRLILSSPNKTLHILTGEFYLAALDYISTADKTREAFNCLIEANALEILSGLASEQ